MTTKKDVLEEMARAMRKARAPSPAARIVGVVIDPPRGGTLGERMMGISRAAPGDTALDRMFERNRRFWSLVGARAARTVHATTED